jgi:hypothetical protein
LVVRIRSADCVVRFNFAGGILKTSLLGNSYGIGLYVWLDGRSNDWFDRWFDRSFDHWLDIGLTAGQATGLTAGLMAGLTISLTIGLTI